MRRSIVVPPGFLRVLATVAIVACSGADRSAGTDTPIPTSPCDPLTYGAKRDGRTNDQLAIQKAIDACAAGTGGTVHLTGGTYLSGPVFLKTNITLDIASDAT